VYGRDEAPGDFAYVEVADEGGGMASETEERAFEPYFSTRGKDRGTGLSAVLGIARAHGAPVTLLNERGRGCTVTLYFPLALGAER
jgi:signal transduction histidine kinase